MFQTKNRDQILYPKFSANVCACAFEHLMNAAPYSKETFNLLDDSYCPVGLIANLCLHILEQDK